MLTDPPVVIDDGNLSRAWAKALVRVFSGSTTQRTTPLLVSIDEFDALSQPDEVDAIRGALDDAIVEINEINGIAKKSRVQRVDATAQTIFPHMCWTPQRPRPAKELFPWYINKVLPKLQKRCPPNRRGTYFSRMISSTGLRKTGEQREVNQLGKIIDWYRDRKLKPINSSTQVTIRDPAKDHAGVRSGFPCLQQVSFARHDGELIVGAYYPSESIFGRGYGNYLGLCRLGCFMAHETGLRLSRVNVFILQPLKDEKVEGPLTKLLARVQDALKVPASEPALGETRT